MKPIIPPPPRDLVECELKPACRILSHRGVDVYIIDGNKAPATMDEIGRIREREFRLVGAGRGDDRDLDDLDFGPDAYRQLIAWDPERKELVAAYRYLLGSDALAGAGSGALRTARLFDYSTAFTREYLPYAVELGRSVVNREAAKAVMGLFVVWWGLGALVREYPDLAYFFGNVSIYRSYPRRAQDLVIRFLEVHHASAEVLLTAKEELAYEPDRNAVYPYSGADYDADKDLMIRELAVLGVLVPPILLSYLGAGRGLLYLATSLDADFAGALEAAIIVPTAGVNDKTRKRFIAGYQSANPDHFRRLRR